MPRIVLSTLNARFAHASFGLRYLMANLGALRTDAVLLEFDIAWRPMDTIEAILRHEPKIVGLGVYIWNVAPLTQLVAELKRIRPDIHVIIGGPQVSYETEAQEICGLADYVVTGEADLEFARLCEKLLSGEIPQSKIIAAPVPAMEQVALPYDLYDQRDIEHRVIYVEASRGCPFTCEFCLSSLDIPVRNVPLESFLAAMQSLLDRSVRQFKFVDRTFNLNLNISRAILEFFWERYTPELFLHFEMIPDRLPAALRDLIVRFPPGALQFEVGVQSFNEQVCQLISRRQDVARLEDNLKFLRRETGVHVHADLIVGLPGEDAESFGAGFDRLVKLAPQEIQVGLLKRLPGTPIVRHDQEWGMVYSPAAPFEILQTKLIDFALMQRLRRFSRYWDLTANSGNFVRTTPLIWGEQSPFHSFLRWSDWLFTRAATTHGIALGNLAEHLFTFLTKEQRVNPSAAAETIWEDYRRTGRSDRPAFLRPWIADQPIDRTARVSRGTSQRQARHLNSAVRGVKEKTDER
jgi:radical SAM superfamily enzyme YgiQ (UPF0313 family)